MTTRKNYIVQQIAKYSQKLDAKNFGANHDGNISARFDDVILATPTAVSKGNVVEDMVITCDMSGIKIAGFGKPFSEIKLHIAAYVARPDANAVVHAHPPFATARGLTNNPLVPSLPEAIVSIGDVVPVIEFSMPGTKESEISVQNVLQEVDVFMIPGNGVFAIGDDIEQAYLRLELVEHLAKIHFYAEQMGMPISLTQPQIQSLLEKRQKAGLGPRARGVSQSSQASNLEKIIAEEILKTLG